MRASSNAAVPVNSESLSPATVTPRFLKSSLPFKTGRPSVMALPGFPVTPTAKKPLPESLSSRVPADICVSSSSTKERHLTKNT